MVFARGFVNPIQENSLFSDELGGNLTDRFDSMQTFVSVVQEESFSEAAKRLGIAKSAVSRRIRDLEDRLGVQLLNRNTQTISLTEIGSQFFEKALRILEDMHDAEALASQAAVKLSGRLRITAPLSFGLMHLAPVIKEFMDRHSDLTIELELNDRMIDIVNEGFDLGLRVSRFEDSSLIARKITVIRHVACASPSYLEAHGIPRTPADLKHHRGISYLYADPTLFWKFGNLPHDDSFKPDDIRTQMVCNNGDALREAAISGMGICILPTFIVYRAIRDKQLQVILQEFQRPPIYLHALYASKRNLPIRTKLFIDFLIEKFGNEPYWDRDIPGLPSMT